VLLNPNIYLSVIYLTTLSVTQDSTVLNGGMIVNNVLERVLNKAVEAAFEVSSQCSLQGIRKTTKLCIRRHRASVTNFKLDDYADLIN
jgi:hypothetical protein